jgi:TPR repeat protein
MYLRGEGTLTDLKQAFFWFKKSAEQGHADAQYNLGLMYFLGDGTSINKSQSAFWIRKSYENGVEAAKDFWDKNELYKY